ncbi:MAG TPA: porin family protein [Bacteroidales bacterium]|nr:porin family protein [Bacteroidales bacterium]HQB22791.1 porin family protein [Bacteroidales bacterium]
MKKIILILISLFFFGNIFAQQAISGGLYVGPTMSWMSTDSKVADTKGMKFGYNFGALVDFNLIEHFAISTGLQFNSLGGNITYDGLTILTPKEGQTKDTLNAGSKLNYRLNYIGIPVSFKGKTNEIGYITYFLKAGVTPLINIKTLGSYGENEKIMLKEINLFNIGWHIGGGIEYSLSGNTRILVELLYTGGLIDVDKTKIVYPQESNPRISLNDIHLKVGILF